MEIEIDLSGDWVEYLRSEITTAGYAVDATDTPDDLSYKFFNIRKRRVPPLCRDVHESSRLSCPQEHQSGYAALKAKFANGDDVTPHLSKTILSDTYEDYLLNDWGIHHFHLGQNISNGFAGRTGPLLFALVGNSDVYFIDIKAHGAWREQELIKTLHEEWPEAIANYRINGVLGLAYQPTNDDIAKLRKAGVQTLVQVDEGVVYGPIGGGYSTAGTSVQSKMLADRYRSLVRDIEKHVKENTDMFIQKIRQHGLEPENKPRFQLLVDENGFHVVEVGSRVAFLVHPHVQG
ncbi:hypothetical protein [Thioalkalivibrio sp. ALMg9]|uniref:hypothetical protein n=1 Tax=Thioalkalivibrio sp. ALMg9 TaxID=1266912 RepID=UPI0012DDD0C2|nr:hypothetical protein [Thioalkalivibrio sp. ALMg9]